MPNFGVSGAVLASLALQLGYQYYLWAAPQYPRCNVFGLAAATVDTVTGHHGAPSAAGSLPIKEEEVAQPAEEESFTECPSLAECPPCVEGTTTAVGAWGLALSTTVSALQCVLCCRSVRREEPEPEPRLRALRLVRGRDGRWRRPT